MSPTALPVPQVLQEYRRRYAWLWGLIQSPHLIGERVAPAQPDPGLYRRRLQSFLDFVGSPETRFPGVLVAGTSGKGSVTTLLARLLEAAGYATGYHISPYLQLPQEKLIARDEMISIPAFNRLLADFARDYGRWQRTQTQYARLRYGEAWVALTFLFLAQEAVDWGIVECGLGGRWDPTNVMQPTLSLITNVGADHLVSLGGTLQSIAHHKAGIIKAGSLALTGVWQPDLLAVLQREADRQGVTLHRVGTMSDPGACTFRYAATRLPQGQQALTVTSPYTRHENLILADRAPYQAGNAALVVAALDLLQAHGRVQIPDEAFRQGLQQGAVPGRLEVMQDDPAIILDCAHNPPKAQALAEALQAAYPDRQFLFVVGMLRTKDAAGILEALAHLPGSFLFCQPHVFGKTSHPPGDLAAVLPDSARHRMQGLFQTVRHALAHAQRMAAPDQVIVVTGSVYLVGEARDLWYPRDQLLAALARRPCPYPAAPGVATGPRG